MEATFVAIVWRLFSRTDETDVVLVSGLTTFAPSFGFVYVEAVYVRMMD